MMNAWLTLVICDADARHALPALISMRTSSVFTPDAPRFIFGPQNKMKGSDTPEAIFMHRLDDKHFQPPQEMDA